MRVLVLGGGYAGLLVTRRLERRLPEDADLVLVDDTGHHLVQHELHRVVRRPDLADVLSIPLEDLTRRARVVEDRVTAVDVDDRRVELASGDVLAYDAAAVCLGAETADYGIPGITEHALPMKRLDDAARARRAFEAVCEDGGRAVVGGAGLSGIQVAGEFAAFAREEGVADDVEVVLVERLDSVAPGFGAEFQGAIRRELEDAGVRVETGVTVAGATASEISFADRDPLGYDAFVWTGGIRGPDALDGDRPRVRATLELAERTFAVGDVARVVDAEGEAVPATAQAAVRAARVAADNLAASLDADSGGFRPHLEQWRFDSPGWVVSVGDRAVARLGPRVLTGRPAEFVKSSAGIRYLATHGALRNAVAVARDALDGELDRSRTGD